MARTGRIGIWPERLGAIWVAAALSALAVVFGALSPWAFGQHRLATWQTPDAEVFWIPAGKTLLPRYPVEGEAPRRLHQLPIGLSSPVQGLPPVHPVVACRGAVGLDASGGGRRCPSLRQRHAGH